MHLDFMCIPKKNAKGIDLASVLTKLRCVLRACRLSLQRKFLVDNNGHTTELDQSYKYNYDKKILTYLLT